MKMLRLQLLCLVILAAVYDLCVWRQYNPELPSWLTMGQKYEFGALTPREHYSFAMALCSQRAPSEHDLKEAIQHLEAIPKDGGRSAYLAAKQLPIVRLRLDRPAEYEAMMQVAKARYERCAAQVQAEALAESEKRGKKPYPFRDTTGKCFVPLCGNYVAERCSDPMP